MKVSVLRELFRQYQQWQALVETSGIDTITYDGEDYCFWDLEYLYTTALPRLANRQREAIQLYLIQNMREVDAARAMGISETNPVGIYATVGLAKICQMIQSGELPRYRPDDE